MKIPESPPDMHTLFKEVIDSKKLDSIFFTSSEQRSQASDYRHWDELRFRKPPEGLNHREWWLAVKMQRRQLYQSIPLKDRTGEPFRFANWGPISERLHFIDLGIGGNLELAVHLTNPEKRDRYLVRSLVEEAITSSQLEGAVTTRQVAKEMIRLGRSPRDRSERMIMNNYVTMRDILDSKDEPMTPERVLAIHRVITEDTLDDPGIAGRLRTDGEPIRVMDEYGTVFHDPPAAHELEVRLAAMCEFANGNTPKFFVHPVIRSIILHFWLAYDHPFVDGNGRVARALFYWCMLNNKYWLCEFVSISHILRKAPVQYYRAFLHTETDENDLTYFIIHQLEVIRKAVDDLHDYIRRESDRMQSLRKKLKGLDTLNHRQQTLIDHAMSHPGTDYTIEGHQRSFRVVYQTARSDLLELRDLGLLTSRKRGRTFLFQATAGLEKKLKELK